MAYWKMFLSGDGDSSGNGEYSVAVVGRIAFTVQELEEPIRNKSNTCSNGFKYLLVGILTMGGEVG
ncbi:hypothetical protein LX64_03130 [Chitinophaga skermanii]|uniref:Uncharacterized protein n=1 Tax=Chitinophaga skermanii TaxID=331697 RepID=A0A327QIR6_9BACT|nr:hypothetical protein LX64_03130 [Chitinophaga skermanii]